MSNLGINEKEILSKSISGVYTKYKGVTLIGQEQVDILDNTVYNGTEYYPNGLYGLRSLLLNKNRKA